MNQKPPSVEYASILCPACMHYDGMLRLLWLDEQTLCFLCSVHGPVMTAQTLNQFLGLA